MTDDSSQIYSEIDEKLFFTSTFLGIPHNLSIIKQSEIPFTLNIQPENYNEDKDSIPISEEEIIRCFSCKSYINPYVEVIPPGLKWKCNLCFNINELSLPISSNRRYENKSSNGFSLVGNAIHNFNTYNRIELRSTVYELHAPSNYSIRTPSSTTLCFLIEASYESLKYGMFKIVLKSILENLESNLFEARAKMIFIFYNSQVMVLSKGGSGGSGGRKVDGSRVGNGGMKVDGSRVGKGDPSPNHNDPTPNYSNHNTSPLSLLILPDSSFIPFLQDDNFLFDLSDKPDFPEIENLFKEIKSPKNNFGDALKVVQVLLKKNGGSIISFLSSSPNCGSGSIDSNDKENLNCKSIFYQEMAGSLAKNLISVSYFLFPRINIELPTLSILSKNTGGLIFYYPNFDGEDPVFTTKLHCDLNQFFNLNLSHDCVCRIRTSKDVFIKEYNGSLNQKTFDLLSFPNFYPPHTFSLDLEIVDNIVADGISLQIALMRTTKKGKRMIRVINLNIPKFKGLFYDLIDPYSIIRSLSLKSFYYESKSKGTGLKYLYSSLIGILKSYKRNTKSFSLLNLPNNLNLLPMLTLSLCKSIPLRPVSYTPVDYKVYYIYLMSVSYSNLIDTIIYPYLVPLHDYEYGNKGDDGESRVDHKGEDSSMVDGKGESRVDDSIKGNYDDKRDLEEALDNMNINNDNININNNHNFIPLNLTRNCLETNGLYLLDTGFTIFFFIGKDCPDSLSNLLFDPLTPSGRIIFDPPKNNFSKKVIDLINDLRKNRFISPFYVLIRDNSIKTHHRDIFFSYLYEDHQHNLPSINEYYEKIKSSLS